LNRVERIRQLVQDRLRPEQLDIRDDSKAHAGHASAGSKGHFHLRLVCSQFSGLTPLQRHRLVYETLAPLFDSDIHALSLIAIAPEELA